MVFTFQNILKSGLNTVLLLLLVFDVQTFVEMLMVIDLASRVNSDTFLDAAVTNVRSEWPLTSGQPGHGDVYCHNTSLL